MGLHLAQVAHDAKAWSPTGFRYPVWVLPPLSHAGLHLRVRRTPGHAAASHASLPHSRASAHSVGSGRGASGRRTSTTERLRRSVEPLLPLVQQGGHHGAGELRELAARVREVLELAPVREALELTTAPVLLLHYHA
jgi:hypothetical protein